MSTILDQHGGRYGQTGAPYALVCLMLALLYGAVLAGLPLELFKDRGNYLNYAENAWIIQRRYLAQGPLAVLANEPVWLLINSVLGTLLPPAAVLRLVIFVPAVIVANLVLRQDPRQFPLLLLFLLIPQVLKNHIVHLRQGVAVAVFLIGWTATRPATRWTCLLITPFIHASFLFVVAMLLLAKLVRGLRYSSAVRVIVFTAIGVGIAVALGWAAAVVGARQVAVYDFASAGGSGFGFLFWLLVLALYLLQGVDFLRARAFEIGIIVFYLSTYFFVEVAARIFESALMVVLLAGARLTGGTRYAFLALIALYAAGQWMPGIGQFMEGSQ